MSGKLFTAIYMLIGIGIQVELAREIGVGYVRERETRHTRRHKEDPPEARPHKLAEWAQPSPSR